MKFHQALVFKKGDGDLFGLYVYNEFACHNFFLLLGSKVNEVISNLVDYKLLLKQRTNPRDK